MSCKKFRKDLIPWLDGELTPERSAELKAWFASCSATRQCTACQTQISQYRAIQQSLQSLPPTELPSFVHHRILDKLNQTQKTRSRQVARIRWQAIPVAAAVLLSLYFGSLVSSKTFGTQSSAATASTETTVSSDLYSFGENSLADVYATEEVTP